MSEQGTVVAEALSEQGPATSLEFDTSGDVLRVPTRLWHAVRGVDVAGLVDILSHGLKPSKSWVAKGTSTGSAIEHTISLSASPYYAIANSRYPGSFLNYSMRPGAISLSVDYGAAVASNGDYGGFIDEVRDRSAGLPAESVKGIMVPADMIDTPLEQISVGYEPRKQSQAAAYMERNIRMINRLAGTFFEDELRTLGELTTANSTDQLTREQNQLLEGLLASQYNRILQSQGVQAPTIQDLLLLIQKESARGDLTYYAWTNEQKTAIVGAGNAICRSAADVGATTRLDGYHVRSFQKHNPTRF